MSLISISKSKEIRGNVHSFFTTQDINFSQFKIILLSCVWSPIVWRGNVRNGSNFKEATYLALDFDDGRYTLRDAEKWVQDGKWSAIIGTSKSHQKEKVSKSGVVQPAVDRFRIVIPFERTITRVAEYKAVMAEILKDIPADQACKDAARFFYPCKEIIFENSAGSFEIPSIPEKILQYSEPQIERVDLDRISEGMFPVWMLSALNYGVPAGQRNVTLFRIAATLAYAGYTDEQILEIVWDSPFRDLGRQEVEQTVRNGIQATEA